MTEKEGGPLTKQGETKPDMSVTQTRPPANQRRRDPGARVPGILEGKWRQYDPDNAGLTTIGSRDY